MLIVVTDGEDTYSRAELKDVRSALRETNIVVYALYVGSEPIKPPFGDSQPLPGEIKGVEKLSSMSGGRVVYPADAKELVTKTEEIAVEVNSQYVIGVPRSSAFVSGKCYSFKVKVVPPLAGSKKVLVRTQDNFCLGAEVP